MVGGAINMTAKEHSTLLCEAFDKEEARINSLPTAEQKQESLKWLVRVGILNPDGTRTKLYAEN